MAHRSSSHAPAPPTAAGADPARLEALRKLMAARNLDVYLVPATDEHQNEFLPAHAQRRQAISGFSGSAGDVAVCADSAHLFVDSRYHLQAEQETDPRLFSVHKLGLENVRELPAFLTALETGQGALQVGFDPYVHSLLSIDQIENSLKNPDSAMVPVVGNLVDEVWRDKPPPPRTPVYALPDELTGETVPDKLLRVRAAMATAGADALVLSKLDELAWLTNLRGWDIPHNPVFDGYLVVTPDEAVVFTDNPVGEDIRSGLAPWVTFAPGEAFRDKVRSLARPGGGQSPRVWMDRQGSSHGVRLLAGDARLHLAAPNPVVRLKARKNPVEIDVSREGHIRAGCAKVRAFASLHAMIDAGKRISEADFAAALYEEYALEEGFADLSFPTIAGYGANGAIVHYSNPSAEVLLEPGGMLLVDSGVQIRGATTDDTRTVMIGQADGEQRARFTDVLRGHIRLALQVFPQGTTGQMLDVLARTALWNHGLDYGHGTGHGVGAFLNVHEGPQNISTRGLTPLEPGMIVSNEPGFYRAGWGGIRLENLYVVEEAPGLPDHPSGKPWLRFSPLTFIPFDTNLTDWERLSSEERDWLTAYHARVAELLAPRLEGAHRSWLEAACRPPA